MWPYLNHGEKKKEERNQNKWKIKEQGINPL